MSLSRCSASKQAAATKKTKKRENRVNVSPFSFLSISVSSFQGVFFLSVCRTVEGGLLFFYSVLFVCFFFAHSERTKEMFDEGGGAEGKRENTSKFRKGKGERETVPKVTNAHSSHLLQKSAQPRNNVPLQIQQVEALYSCEFCRRRNEKGMPKQKGPLFSLFLVVCFFFFLLSHLFLMFSVFCWLPKNEKETIREVRSQKCLASALMSFKVKEVETKMKISWVVCSDFRFCVSIWKKEEKAFFFVFALSVCFLFSLFFHYLLFLFIVPLCFCCVCFFLFSLRPTIVPPATSKKHAPIPEEKNERKPKQKKKEVKKSERVKIT
jgi:hypothetical protein